MIIWDEDGRIIFSACRFLMQCEEPFEAELKALASRDSEGHIESLYITIDIDCAQLVTASTDSSQGLAPFFLFFEEKIFSI